MRGAPIDLDFFSIEVDWTSWADGEHRVRSQEARERNLHRREKQTRDRQSRPMCAERWSADGCSNRARPGERYCGIHLNMHRRDEELATTAVEAVAKEVSEFECICEACRQGWFKSLSLPEPGASRTAGTARGVESPRAGPGSEGTG